MRTKKKWFLLLCTASTISVQAAATPAWVTESNQDAQPLLQVIAQFSPERAGALGVDGFDEQVIDLKPQVYERSQAAFQQAQTELQSRLQKTRDVQVQQDLQIMLDKTQKILAHSQLEHELLLPYESAAQLAFDGLHAALDPRVSKTRQAAAPVRLRRYAGLEPGSTAITQLLRERSEERFADKALVGPYRAEVEQNLADSPRLMEGIGKLFVASGLQGYEPALKTLSQQVSDYDRWTRKNILPRARSDNRLPAALYADNLRQIGVPIAPEELIRRSLLAFAELRNEMRALAPLVAKEKGYSVTDYRDVIHQLKKQQLVGDAILPLYQQRLAAIEDILRREHEVTVPERKAVIRLASEAESAQQPAPHMSAPRLIGNTGEYGEFVLPLKTPGGAGEKDLVTDDFTFEAGAWTLTAHEARPGHELQFSSMIEHGVSIARAVFAFNSVNVEGWGLYSEAEMKPYFPLDGQLIVLQLRMLRAARAFLDPMVNLGQITPAQVKQFLIDQVALSEGFAKEEMDRFTFRSPGQATSYFYGYQAIVETRERAEFALGAKFDKQRFHDFVLAQGLLPPELLQRAVLEQFVPAEMAQH